jgi:hypothetical protein
MISRKNRRGYVCSLQNRLPLFVQVLLALNVVSTPGAQAAQAALNFAGAPFSPGSTVKANVLLSAQEIHAAMESVSLCVPRKN